MGRWMWFQGNHLDEYGDVINRGWKWAEGDREWGVLMVWDRGQNIFGDRGWWCETLAKIYYRNERDERVGCWRLMSAVHMPDWAWDRPHG